MELTKRRVLYTEGLPSAYLKIVEDTSWDEDVIPILIPTPKSDPEDEFDQLAGAITHIQKNENGEVTGLVPMEYAGEEWSTASYFTFDEPDEEETPEGFTIYRGGVLKSVSFYQ